MVEGNGVGRAAGASRVPVGGTDVAGTVGAGPVTGVSVGVVAPGEETEVQAASIKATAIGVRRKTFGFI